MRALYRGGIAARRAAPYILSANPRGRCLPTTIQQTVRDVCLGFPDAVEATSHGSTSFKVRGKIFAYFLINHHGDGRVALWISATPETQQSHVKADPVRYFVPPYLGPRGWLGVTLDQGLPWNHIAALTYAAYQRVAPASLRRIAQPPPNVRAPRRKLAPRDLDPLRSRRGAALLKVLRALCLGLPDTREAEQFGHPAWLAGNRTFAVIRAAEGRMQVRFWVGVDQQSLLLADPRYRIPPYVGHNGWIELDVSGGHDPVEMRGLALASYRHFASRRMLRLLPDGV